MFYHISREKGLTELEPRVSTHKEAWVYALTDPAIGLIFAGRDNFFKLSAIQPDTATFGTVINFHTMSLSHQQSDVFTHWTFHDIPPLPSLYQKDFELQSILSIK